MKSFRNPEYLERYEDVVFDLEQALETPANNAHQTKTNYRFVADNTGEATPFDWFNARFSVDFKVQLLNGTNFNNNNLQSAESGIVNGNKYTKRQVLHRRNSANTADDAGLMLDDVEANYNKGFAIRRTLIGNSSTISCDIPFNRYSFFESLDDKLLPNTKIELNIELESDGNLIWRTGGNDCRVILTRFQLFVPRITFNKKGQELYMKNYLKPYKWIYLNEVVERSNNSQQQTGQFRITNAISKPRHVFVFAINTANIDSQTANPFLYNTFNLPNNANISRCYLEVGNGNEYPDIHLKPATDPARVFREVMSYVYANNDFQGGTLLNRTNFESLFPFVYFDLTKQKMDIKDRVTKLAFHYELSANPNADYNIYAIVLHERVAEIEQQGGKLLLRA